MATEITKKLFTVGDYFRMAEAGILSEDDRVELIHGEVLAMSPIGARHAAAVDRATRALVHVTGERAIVRIQGPVGLDQYSMPQPDIVLLRPKEDFYSAQHPSPADILLIVEVADSSLKYDRTIKKQLYAEAGIPEYWIADLTTDSLLAYSETSHDSYQAMHRLHRGDSIAPRLLPECQVRIDVLLP